jgi:archaeosine-15-forming tRNA-guanine transglycosylase
MREMLVEELTREEIISSFKSSLGYIYLKCTTGKKLITSMNSSRMRVVMCVFTAKEKGGDSQKRAFLLLFSIFF